MTKVYRLMNYPTFTAKEILRELEDLPGITIRGHNPKNVRHVDDIVFIAVTRTFCIHPVQSPKATRVRRLQRHSL